MNTKSFTILRELAIYFVAGLITLLTSTTALAAPPSTPNDLRADVYSSTAAEIFWTRSTDPDGFVSGYEVRQDGELVATFDGLSFFIDELSEGVSTEFSVTAIDSDNERSGAASITVTSGNSNDVLNNTDDRPTPPANLNAIVYSTSAAEVFWDRNSDQPLSYEVSLDGIVVTTTSGTSYFNGNLEAGRSFAIDVVAVDLNGQRSDAANAVINTSGDTNANQPTGQPPSQPSSSITSPTNLRLEVYSGTAGELFWDRSAQAGEIETTEVRRDGVALATTQGNSFFDNTRTAGVLYRYEVVFLGFNGAQSGPAVFDESGSSATPPPLTNAPAAPANARILVYSGTAAELFWDRAEPSADITETQVLRDGSLIGTTQGNSFFDGSRVSGIEYRYELQSINSSGVRSEVVVLGETSEVQTPTTPNTTRVTFAITVPAYMSNELQVRLESGDINTTAAFVRDESWSASEDFLINTDNPLVVTFADGNGAITLGTAETSFRTGTAESETVQITVDQFNTERFDNDSDGISNLDELIAGTFSEASSEAGDLPQPVQASLEILPIKTFRISWQPSANAEFYRVLENPDGNSGFSPVSEDIDASTQTFDLKVALFNRVNARYIVQACNTSGCVDSEPLLVIGSLESAIGYFKASNTDVERNFGDTVSLSSDGNTLAVGAFGLSPEPAINGEANAVYVFQLINGNFVLEAVLTANTGDGFGTRFGTGISLAEDGNTLAVGAAFQNAVYVFERTNGQWQEQAFLEPSIADENDSFGTAVSLNADATTLVVGAIGEDSASTGVNGNSSDNSLLSSGAVYVFERNNGEWQQQAYLKSSNPEDFDRFGADVSVSSLGSTLAVWAQGEDSAATGVNGDQDDNSAESSGAVYVFERANGIWEQQAYLKASNTDELDSFGVDISFSFDGDILAIGAASESSAGTGVNGDQTNPATAGTNSGAVYLFERIDTNVGTNQTWQQQVYLKASNPDAGDTFGASVDLSADGLMLAIGAPREESAASGINGDQNDNSFEFRGPGAAYIFENSDGAWQQRAFIKASNPGDFDRFGSSVSLSSDGKTLAVGAEQERSAATGVNGDQSDNSAINSGAVYLY